MKKITLKTFTDSIYRLIELAGTKEHKLDHAEFLKLQDLVIKNISNFGNKISKSRINTFKSLFMKTCPFFRSSRYRYRFRYGQKFDAQGKVLSIIIYLKLINKIKLCSREDEFAESIVLCIEHPDFSSTTEQTDYLIKTVKNYAGFYKEPLNLKDTYNCKSLSLPLYKLMFDLENKYGYYSYCNRANDYDTKSVFYECRLFQCFSGIADSEEQYSEEQWDLLAYALDREYIVKLNDQDTGIKQIKIDISKKYFKKIIRNCFLQDRGSVRLDMISNSDNLKSALEVAGNMNETFLDKRLSNYGYLVGNSRYWADKHHEMDYTNAVVEMISHDLKVQNGVLNINIHNIPCLLRLGLMPHDDDAFNITGSDAAMFELAYFFDGMIRSHNSSSQKRLRKNYKNVLKSKKMKALLKKIVFQEEPRKADGGFNVISNFFIFSCFDNPTDKINFILSKLLNNFTFFDQTFALKDCLGIDVEYIEKNKQDFLKIPQKQRKQIYSVLAKKEKNIFNKVALKDCLAI